MALLPNAGIQAFICSAKNKIEHFVSGFAGNGWKIWEWITGRYKLEVDDLTVRRTMTVYELIISKIRSIVGSMAITQAHGKIKEVDGTSDLDNYLITLEDTNCFVAYDFIRMQEFTGGQRSYWVQVSQIRGETVVIPKAEFESEMSRPEIGDEIVQFGNSHDTTRQSAIYLHADESGQPAIDVMFDIDSKSFDGKVKLRLGAGLPGVGDDCKGLYAENGMLKFTDAQGNLTSQIWPDGTAELGAGSVKINPDRSGYIGGEGGLSWHWDTTKNKFICEFGNNAVLRWSNLSEDAKENLKGEPGKDGVIYYTWLRYADDASGKGISNSPVGKKYMGFAYNKLTPVESNTPSDYTWGLFRGENGTDGVPGPKGEDGKTTYTWIAYSDNVDGSNMYQLPNDNTKYIGIAVNKNTATESNNPNDYVWSKFKGEDGENGKDANLLPWVQDWQDNSTTIGNDHIISPKIFSGTRDSAGAPVTGVALGRKVINVDGKEKTGLFGIKDGKVTFSLDADTGEAKFTGEVNATSGKFHGEVNATSGTFRNVQINGSIRSPFAFVDSFTHYSDNIVVPEGSGSWVIAFNVPWDTANNGRKVTVVNFRPDKTSGVASASSPENMYFYEHGIRKDNLIVKPDSVVELIGIGTPNVFWGWIVLNRMHVGNDQHNAVYGGKPASIIAMGEVTYATSNGPCQVRSWSYNNTDITVTRFAKGKYRMELPATLGIKDMNFIPMLTGTSGSNGSTQEYPCDATIMSKTPSELIIHVSDDASENDASFNFVIYNTNQW